MPWVVSPAGSIKESDTPHPATTGGHTHAASPQPYWVPGYGTALRGVLRGDGMSAYER